MTSEPATHFKKYIIPVIIALIAGSSVSIFLSYRYFLKGTVRDVTAFLESVNTTERGYIEKIPLYDDYATPQLEMKLRTRLFPAHMAIALASGNRPLERDEDIPALLDSGKLIKLKTGKDVLYYFYNVQDRYRILTPDTVRGLDLLAQRFQATIAARATLPQVKIAVSSALRPASYQEGLRETNNNATPTTTHSYGVSFDIFYDDYFVVLASPESSNPISRAILEPLRNRFGFMLGDSLRGQFRSVLTETLSQMQDEGALYAILEKRQRCYHVTVLPKGITAKQSD